MYSFLNWLFYLLDDLSMFCVRYQNGELRDISSRLTAGTGIFKLSSDVCEAITVEEFFAIVVLAEDFDVNFAERLHVVFMMDLKLTKFLVELHSE